MRISNLLFNEGKKLSTQDVPELPPEGLSQEYLTKLKAVLDAKFRSTGEGSSRKVYIINSKKVLKIAMTDVGVKQNKKEFEIFSNNSNEMVFTKIFSHQKDFIWLVSELVKPFVSQKEFIKSLDVSERIFNKIEEYAMYSRSNFQNFMRQLSVDAQRAENNLKYPGLGYSTESEKKTWETLLKLFQELNGSSPTTKFGNFIKIAYDLNKKFDLNLGDIFQTVNWGTTANGNLKLLDYGITTEMFDDLY